MATSLCPKKSGTSKTLRTLALSYGVVLLLPLLFGVFLYSIAIRIVSVKSEQAQRQVLNHVEESVNFSFESMNNIMDTLLVNQDVSYLTKRHQFDRYDYQRMKTIQDKLNFACLSNSYIDDVLLYFHSTDAVLGSRSWFSNVGASVGRLDLLTMNATEFQEQLAQKNDLRFFIATNAYKAPFVIRSNASSTVSGSPSLTILIRLTKDALTRMMKAQDAETFLFDENGGYLCTGGANRIGAAADVLSAAENGSDFGAYRLLDLPSALLSIRYVRLIPDSVYAQDVMQMLWLLYGYILICLLLGLPVTAHMVQRSYNPIKQIVSILPVVSSPQEADDFTRIEQSLTELTQRNLRNESKIDKQADGVRSHLLHKLLQEGESFGDEFKIGCEDFGIQFPYGSWLIAAVDVEDGSSLFFENRESVNREMSQLAFFAAGNLLREQLKASYPCFIAEHDGLLVALVNIDVRLDKDHVLAEMRAFGRELYEHMKNDFRVLISLSVSSIHEGFGGVQTCWQEILEMLRHRDSEKTAPLLLYRDISINEEQAALEKEAIRAIHGHAYSKARELLKQALRQPDEEQAVLKAAEAEAVLPSEDASFLTAILKYIDENYTDQSLSIAAIAEQFNLSPSYFSLYFKRKMSIPPLEYINLKRIEKVKDLLATDLPIKAIARDVGYFDTRPMIRFFKRGEGITPTEYREQLHRDD